MPKLSKVAARTFSGAAAGSAFGPWGTVIGGGLGAVSSFFGDDEDASAPPAYTPDPDNFTFGLRPFVDANGVVHPTPEERAAATDAWNKANPPEELEKLNAQAEEWDRQHPPTLVPDNGGGGDGAGTPTYVDQGPNPFREKINGINASHPANIKGGTDNFAAQRTRQIVADQNTRKSVADAALTRGAPQMDGADAITQDRSGGMAYLDNADWQSRQEQLQALGGIKDFANAAEGPSAAQAQLQAGTDAAMRQQYGMARSQRGGGGAALRNAAFNAAGIEGNAANSAAMLRAQENQAYRARQLQALGTAQSGAAQLRGADIGLASTRAGQANVESADVNRFNEGQQKIQQDTETQNLNAALTGRAQSDALYLGVTDKIQRDDAERHALADSSTAGSTAFEAAKAGAAGLQLRADAAAQAQENRNEERDIGLAKGAAEAAATLLPPKDKPGATPGATPAAPPPPKPPGTPPTAPTGSQSNGGEITESDVRAKRDIKRIEVARSLSGGFDMQGLDAASARLSQDSTRYPTVAPDMRPAKGYEYSYKDPARYGEGRYVGPMAQDLEHIPGVVRSGKNGNKTIDAPRLTLANTAAVGEQQRRLDRLEQLTALRGQPPLRGSGFVRPELTMPDLPQEAPAMSPTEYPSMPEDTRFAPTRRQRLQALGGPRSFS